MPTAAKMVAALAFAALAWIVSDMVVPLLSEGTPVGRLHIVNAALGGLMGWRVMGPRVGEGLVRAFGVGVSTVAATLFWCLLAWGGHAMVKNSTRMLYDGPVEALLDMSGLMIEYLLLIATVPIIATMLLGALIGSSLSELASRRWP